jgi:hypothetical protein
LTFSFGGSVEDNSYGFCSSNFSSYKEAFLISVGATTEVSFAMSTEGIEDSEITSLGFSS